MKGFSFLFLRIIVAIIGVVGADSILCLDCGVAFGLTPTGRTGEIKGQVLDSDGTGVSGVKVSIRNGAAGQKTETASDGSFVITDVVAGSTIVFEKSGCEKKEKKVEKFQETHSVTMTCKEYVIHNDNDSDDGEEETVTQEESQNRKIDELRENAQNMKDKEQSTANKLLGGATIGLTGIGGMQLAEGLAQKAADEDAELDMAAYLATFRCNWNNATSVRGGEKNIQIPGSGDLAKLVTEYKELAADLKMRKEQLGMAPGIESEQIIDSATTGLYDDVGIGRGDGAYTSIADALSDPEGADAAEWAAQKKAASDKVKLGAGLAIAGTVVGVAGNLIINRNQPKENSDKILSRYETIIKQLFADFQGKINEIPPETEKRCPDYATKNSDGDCECKDSKATYNPNTYKCDCDNGVFGDTFVIPDDGNKCPDCPANAPYSSDAKACVCSDTDRKYNKDTKQCICYGELQDISGVCQCPGNKESSGSGDNIKCQCPAGKVDKNEDNICCDPNTHIEVKDGCQPKPGENPPPKKCPDGQHLEKGVCVCDDSDKKVDPEKENVCICRDPNKKSTIEGTNLGKCKCMSVGGIQLVAAGDGCKCPGDYVATTDSDNKITECNCPGGKVNPDPNNGLYKCCEQGQILDVNGNCVNKPEQTPQNMIAVSIPGDGLFNIGETELNGHGRNLLKSFVDKLNKADLKELGQYDCKFTVNGYADPVGSKKRNEQLSENRAQSVKEYLRKNITVNFGYLVNGYGEKDCTCGANLEWVCSNYSSISWKDSDYKACMNQLNCNDNPPTANKVNITGNKRYAPCRRVEISFSCKQKVPENLVDALDKVSKMANDVR